MRAESIIVQTKLIPLRPLKRTLPRPRLTVRLHEAIHHRITILHAGPGYGKSTALSTLLDYGYPLVWYHMDAEDTDPLVFLRHLLYGFYATLETLSQTPMALTEDWEGSNADQLSIQAVDALTNELARNTSEPILLILDDAHLLNQSPGALRMVERLAKHGPANLHIILSCRSLPALSNLVTMRVRGELLEISESELAFTTDEIQTLFREHYGHDLSTDDVAVLTRETEGWAIALQLVWQGFSRSSSSRLSQALEQFSGLKEDLFTYLAQEVLEHQPAEIQSFLTATAVLRQMSPSICDCVYGGQSSGTILRRLIDEGLFVVELGDSKVRYHYLFHEFLYARLSEAQRHDIHLKAASCYQTCGQGEEAIYHYLKAEAFDQAVGPIYDYGRGLVMAGRLEILASWLASLPAETLAKQPALISYLGDIARLRSRFDEALHWYCQSEEQCRASGDLRGVAQALRGQARVYLDTVNPSQAVAPLREALRITDGQEDREARAVLLELYAENQLNLGRSAEAQDVQEEARRLREEGPGEAELDVRVLLRTGRLDEALQRLQAQAEVELKEPVLRPRAHRETLLLLALIQACQGEGEAAYHNAVEGTKRGQALNSPFVTAVGLMRQGHAWLIRDDVHAMEQARACFEQAVALSEQLAVARLKVEANWGLCRVHGYQGDLVNASRAARQGIEIAQLAGDEWITAHIRTAMGASFALAGRFAEALEWLALADAGFRECTDTYGTTIIRLWQCLVWHESGDAVRLQHSLDELLQRVQTYGYDYLITRKTVGGPPDPRRLIPILLQGRALEKHTAYANSLLKEMGLEHIELHPGYQVRVNTLGAFRVWLGQHEVSAGDWQREKARQLFQLLLTFRRVLLDREKIAGLLWPDLSTEAANRDFKVALNALYRALEPQRESGASSAFVMRDGSLYGLRSEADLWLDADQFEHAVAEGDTCYQLERSASLEHYRRAVGLYQGDFLEEYIYEEWCDEERERLRTLYLRAADRLARGLLELRNWEEAIEVCQLIINRDDCWENAYRLMMVAYARLGNRAQSLRVYQNLVDRLHSELDADPAPETEALYHLIAHSSLPDLPPTL